MKFFADLNPYFPSRGERRYAVFYRRDKSDAPTRAPNCASYSSRRSAEASAKRLQKLEDACNT